jgi:8-oxo-dGTP diphosphatase
MTVNESWYYRDVLCTSEWYPCKRVPKITPITQAYGVCFCDDGKIAIVRSSAGTEWSLPGGTPERGETPIATLIREIDEEISMDIIKPKLLGYCKTICIDKDGKPWKHPVMYQLRYFAVISKIKKHVKDPDTNKLRTIKFMDSKDFKKYIKWGAVGDKIIETAYKEYIKYRDKK